MENPRLNQILEMLRNNKNLTVDEIAKTLFISPATARRDLVALEKSGLIIKRYGKILPVVYGGNLLPFELRLKKMNSAKEKIGRKAAEFVHDGEKIFIDSSSTCAYLVDSIKGIKNLTVITNCLSVVTALSDTEITVYCLGGKFVPYTRAFVGAAADKNFDMFQCDKYFFSVAAVDTNGILSDGSEQESTVYQKLLLSNAEKILLCDSSKIGKKALMAVGNISDLDRIISEADIGSAFENEEEVRKKLVIAQ